MAIKSIKENFLSSTGSILENESLNKTLNKTTIKRNLASWTINLEQQPNFDYLSTEITNIKTSIENQKKDLDNQKNELINLKSDLLAERNNIIGSMSLFVAFFTFISINITIFSKVDDIFTALILMFWMIISISIMLMIFFLFLTHKKWDSIFKNPLFLILLLLIFINIFALYYFNNINKKIPLSPSLEAKVIDINEKNSKLDIKIDNEIKLLKYENNLLKDKLENLISKEVEFQLLKQQPKNTSN